MSTVKIDWESDPKKVLDAMKAIEAENIKLKGRIEEVARGGEKAHKEHEGAIDRGIGKLREMSIEYFGLKAAVDQYLKTKEREVQLAEKSLELQKGSAAAKVQLASALSPMSPQEQLAVDARVKQLREITLHSGAGNIFAGAAAQGQGLSLDQKYNAARVAGLLQPGADNEQSAAALAGDIAHMQRLTGAGSAEEAYGKLSAMGSASGLQITDIAERLVPRAETMTQHGESFDQAAAALAAFEGRFGAKRGSGAYEALAGALDDKEKFRPTAKIAGGTLARLDALRNNPELLRKFLKSDAGQALNADNRAALNEYVKGNLRDKIGAAALPSAEQASSDTKARIEALHRTPEQVAADNESRREMAEKKRIASHPELSNDARARAAMEEILNLPGVPTAGRYMKELEFKGGDLGGANPVALADSLGSSFQQTLRSQGHADVADQIVEILDELHRSNAQSAREQQRANALLERQNTLLEEQADRDKRSKRGREGASTAVAGGAP
jgi:hypothetical protein